MLACMLLIAVGIGGCTGPNRPDCVAGIQDGLGGCAPGTAGYKGPSPLQEALAAAVEQHTADMAACRAKFSENNKEAVARARCFNEADQKYAPTTRYPDLISLVIAKRTELAERQAAGKITHAQLMFELQLLVTQLASEEQRRNNAYTAVEAQQQANRNAAALMLLQTMQANRPAPYQLPMPAPSPRTLNTNCQTYGTTTNCQTQ